MKLTARALETGQRPPHWWYAPSYYDHERDYLVAYPIGIHWLVNWARNIWFWIRYKGRSDFREQTERHFFQLGLGRGNERYVKATSQLEDRIKRIERENLQAYRRGWNGALEQIERDLKAGVPRSLLVPPGK